MSDSEIQSKLVAATKLLYEIATLAEASNSEVSFMGMVFEPHFGWFTPDGELQAESPWNESSCVIGSAYAEGYGMDGWKTHKPRFKTHPNK